MVGSRGCLCHHYSLHERTVLWQNLLHSSLTAHKHFSSIVCTPSVTYFVLLFGLPLGEYPTSLFLVPSQESYYNPCVTYGHTTVCSSGGIIIIISLMYFLTQVIIFMFIQLILQRNCYQQINNSTTSILSKLISIFSNPLKH
jgi:hypothetical protein